MPQNLMLRAALYYAKLGFSIIPVGKDKKALIKWQQYQEQPASKKEIHDWFKKFPFANIGIVTGDISGLTVIDADSEAAFALLNEYLPDSALIPTVQTPKGKHLYFKYNPNFSNAVRLISEIDIRNNGGYVVAPPSKNGKGNAYGWFKGLELHNAELQPIPATLLDILLNSPSFSALKNSSYSSSMRQTESNAEVTQSNKSNIFTEGRRDNDIFRIANCLIKGGMPQEEVHMYLKYISNFCDPPFSESEAAIKIESAVKRSLGRDKITTDIIRDWVKVTTGNFLVKEMYHEVNIVTSDLKTKARVILGRLVKEGIIEKAGKHDGCYRKVDTDSKKIDLANIETKDIDIKLPLDLNDLVMIQPKNIIVVAGERDSGKSCFCLNVARMNLNCGMDIRYLTSEMGGAELKSRLLKFEPETPYEHWSNCSFHERSANFQDVILPNGLTIIDYLKLEDSFYLIGGEIKRIFDKLENGVVVIALQKKYKERLGVGGQFTLDEARLYVTLSSNPPEGGIARIEKAKNWRREDFNPNHRETVFKIYKGAHLQKGLPWELKK